MIHRFADAVRPHCRLKEFVSQFKTFLSKTCVRRNFFFRFVYHRYYMLVSEITYD